MAKSKVVQIVAHTGAKDEPDVLYALTEDGDIWVGDWDNGKFTWARKLPQPGSE